MNGKRGRPAKPKYNLNLVTADKMVELIKEELKKRYTDPGVVERKSYSKGTLYNLRSKDLITRHGDRKCALFDPDEVIRKLVS